MVWLRALSVTGGPALGLGGPIRYRSMVLPVTCSLGDRPCDLPCHHLERGGSIARDDPERDVVGAGAHELQRYLACAPPALRIGRNVDRRRECELARVATRFLERGAQRVTSVEEVGDVPGPVAGHDPALGVPCRKRDPAAALAAEPQRRTGGADRS